MAEAKKKETTTTIEQKVQATIIRLVWYKRIWEWIVSLFVNEFELIVWFHSETQITDRGTKHIKKTEKTFLLKKITKKSPKHIIGKDIFGKPFEIKTVEPFDYQIRKLR